MRQCCCASTSGRGEYVRNRLFIAIPALCLAMAAMPLAKARHGTSQVETGKYIVEQVAHCGSCHTPRLPNGDFDDKKRLMGARQLFRPPRQNGRWADSAPRIAGLPRWEDEEVVILLMTGKLETGIAMRPPMPQFHMTKADAAAVVAYLRSLSPPRASTKRHRTHIFATSKQARDRLAQSEPGPK